MPGPISDSYDPEFSTEKNAVEVAEAMKTIVDIIGKSLDDPTLHPIIDVVRGKGGAVSGLKWTERSLRVIRFGLNRALESM